MTQPNPNSGSSKWTDNTSDPAPQQTNLQPPAGQQWGQPAPRKSFGASLGRVNKNFWVFLAATVATFVTAFLPMMVGRSREEFGLITRSFNWWGQLSVSTPVSSDITDMLLEEAVPEDMVSDLQAMTGATLFIIAIQALATFFAYKEKRKTGAIIGIAIFALQVIVSVPFLVLTLAGYVSGAQLYPGAGLCLWSIISVVGLVMSIKMLRNRKKNQQPPQNWGGPQAPQAPQQFQQPQASQPNQPNNWGQPGFQWGQPDN